MTADPFDAVLDARSEALYDSDPSEEPDTREVSERSMGEPGFACIVDESAGFR